MSEQKNSQVIIDETIAKVMSDDLPDPSPPPATPTEKLKEEGEKPAPTPAFDFSAIEIPKEFGVSKKPDAPKSEKSDEDEPPDIKNADVKTREAFAKMRTQLNETREEITNLKKTPHPNAPDNSARAEEIIKQTTEHRQQVEELQTQLNQVYDQLGRFSLDADPRFHAKYKAPQTAIVASLKRAASEWEIKEDVIDQCLKLGPRKRSEMLADIAPDAPAALASYFTQYDHVEEMKQMDLVNHKQSRNDLTVEDGKKGQAAKIALAQAAIAKATNDGHVMFRKIEGNEQWNKVVDAVQNKIKATVMSDDPAMQAESMILGAAVPIYAILLAKETTKRKELESQLNGRNKARAKLDGSPGEPPALKQPTAMTADQAVKEVMKED